MGKEKFISRVNNGWQVRITNPDHNVDTQWFGDSSFGNEDKALKEAVKYRDQLLREYDMSLAHGRISTPRRISNKTKTGIVGISYNDGVWKAHYHNKITKKQKNKHFSISKYGECKAFELACEYRFKKCGPLRVYKGYSFPCDIPVEYELLEGRENKTG